MNQFEQNSTNPLEVLGNLKNAHIRYWHLSWPPALAIFLLCIAVILKLPDYFVADFVIHVQPQQIQGVIMGSPDKKDDAQKFDSLVQELISRPKMLSIIERFKLYPENSGISGQEKALLKFNKARQIESLHSVISKSEDNSPIFRVRFTHKDSKTAYDVANELQNLFVQESLITIRSETRGTEEFLTSQLKDIQKKLETIENKRQEYIQKNVGKMPVQRERAISDQRDIQSKLLYNTQVINENIGRIRYLEQDLAMTVKDPSTAGGFGGGMESQLGPEASLEQMQQNLALLKTRYSDMHPDIIALQKRIEAYKSGIRTGSKPTGPKNAVLGSTSNTRESRMIKREISELQVRNSALSAEQDSLKTRLAELDKVIQSIPIKEQELIEIERDYDSTKQFYEKLTQERERATLQGNLNESQRGSRFKIIEPPVMPRKPAGPPRLIILTAAVVASLLIFFGIPIAFFFFNSSLKFKGDVETEIKIPVLGVIPPLDTPGVKNLNRKVMLTSLTTSALTAFIGLIVIMVSL